MYSHSERELDTLVAAHCKRLAKVKELKGLKCSTAAKKLSQKRTPRSGGVSLSQRASDYYQTKYVPNQKPGKFGAFVIRADGAWGGSWGQRNEQAAIRRAMRGCTKHTTLGSGNVSIFDVVNNDVAKSLKLKCQVVHVHRP